MDNQVKNPSVIPNSQTKLTIQHVVESIQKDFHPLFITWVARRIIIVMQAHKVVDKGGFPRSYQSLFMNTLKAIPGAYF